MEPLVSVLVPAWNGAAVLPDALASLLVQTETRWEALVVDDGSSDATRAIADGFARRDPRIRVLAQANAGTQAARNTALRDARAARIALLDQDDVWLPRKLAVQLSLACRHPRANLLFTNYSDWDGMRPLALRYRSASRVPSGDVAVLLAHGCLFQASTVMLPRPLALELGGFNPRFRYAGDWDMWLRIAERGIEARGTFEPLMHYRRWAGNESRHAVAVAREVADLFEVALTRPQSPALHRACRRSLQAARANLELATLAHEAASTPRAAAGALWRAWRHHPRRMKTLLRCAGMLWPASCGGRLVHRAILDRIRHKWRWA